MILRPQMQDTISFDKCGLSYLCCYIDTLNEEGTHCNNFCVIFSRTVWERSKRKNDIVYMLKQALSF